MFKPIKLLIVFLFSVCNLSYGQSTFNPVKINCNGTLQLKHQKYDNELYTLGSIHVNSETMVFYNEKGETMEIYEVSGIWKIADEKYIIHTNAYKIRVQCLYGRVVNSTLFYEKTILPLDVNVELN